MSEYYKGESDVAGDFGIRPIAPVQAGKYEVRLARTPEEVAAAQKLRYRVMYQEKGGRPDLQKVKLEADVDQWDERAFHIIVVEKDSSPVNVLGTLRLVSNLRLTSGQHFYTEEAFDLSGLRSAYTSMLELGRFCIDANARQGLILMLIWKYAMQFIVDNRIEVMLGCASFPGTDVSRHAGVLAYLYRHNLAPERLRPSPVVSNYVRIPDVVSDVPAFDEATRDIPTLLRGYLKLGARISDTAIIDPIFNTTFICIYVDAREMLSESTVLVTSRS
ncbi:MAG: GNAT family N-acetyltransferase [Pseudomonadales bacterium]|nr:GNAT family N-acetyltransferase [Pseudomonadales bacterium]